MYMYMYMNMLCAMQIADFGVSDEFTGEDLLLTGSAGTPAFMAPETLREGADQFHGRVGCHRGSGCCVTC